jgi:uncharacterized protein (DUF58 family)
MDSRAIRELFSLRDVRNAVVGIVVLFGGLGLAAVTYLAHIYGNPRLAGIAAGVSLIFVLLILIFVVPPLVRNASREASQLNLPFEFTTGGAVMLGLIAIVGFSAWNTANNLLFLVLSFMSAAMIVGFFAGGVCLKKLEIKMRFPETIFAGEETQILVNLSNRKRLFPSYSVVAEVRGTERDESIAASDLRRILPEGIAKRLSRPPILRRTLDYFVYVPRRTETESKAPHIFPYRGRFLIKDFELSTKFPLGFFRHRRRLPARETELIVFPKLADLDPHLDDAPLEIGNIVATKRGSGQDLLALRDYLPNDDLRRIDWKATARTRHLIVREFSAEDDKKVTIYLDDFVPASEGNDLTVREKLEAEQKGDNPVRSERFEHAVSIAAALLSHFTEEQAEIRLVIAGAVGEFGIGSRHLHDCLKRLAVLEPRFTDQGESASGLKVLGELMATSETSHTYLISASNLGEFPPEIVQKSHVVAF